MITPSQIRGARAMLNLTQAELAAKAGISTTGLNNIERGASDPKASTLAAIQRALEEGWSMVLEGVHLVPGMLPPVDGALVVQCVLSIRDRDSHSGHFSVRDTATGGMRALEKYLERIEDIRRIQEYIVRRAERTGVRVIDNGSVEGAVGEVMELVLSRAEQLEAVT